MKRKKITPILAMTSLTSLSPSDAAGREQPYTFTPGAEKVFTLHQNEPYTLKPHAETVFILCQTEPCISPLHLAEQLYTFTHTQFSHCMRQNHASSHQTLKVFTLHQTEKLYNFLPDTETVFTLHETEQS